MTSDIPDETRLNNFDSLRLLASLFVIITHSFALLGMPQHDLLFLASGRNLSFSILGVYIFFVISGYLVTGSLMRTPSLASFFVKRLLRIFPGLIVVVFLSVFVAGPLLTSLPVGEYFSKAETWKYLKVLSLYQIQFKLPGIFEQNAYPAVVNGSLWTLAYEFTFYMVMAGFAVLGKKRLPLLVGMSIIALMIFRLTIIDNFLEYKIPGLWLYIEFLVNFGLFFLIGSLFFFVPREFFTHKCVRIGALASILLFFWKPLIMYIIIPLLVIVIAYVPWPFFRRLSRTGDYSYGFYIYAFPIQQILSPYFVGQNPYLFAAIAILCIAPFAVASWHLVEKRALKLKLRLEPPNLK